MTIELTLKSDNLIEFGFGKLIKGKEMQVYQEYFPLIHPVLEECGIQPLLSFVVLATNTSSAIPDQGALTHVPSRESFVQFHNDHRFIEAKPIRDDAMEFLSSGNFFRSIDKIITLDPDTDYALILSKGNPLNSNPLLKLSAAQDSLDQTYTGKTLTLHPWNDEAAQLIGEVENVSNETVVFKIHFNPSSS
ncbi:hypothetical protein A9Q81_20875 [Gammaproteobacteria bacterium 42_54_T18]|nr:hypothetical protein A9Q81_20875 [Gammaproteobacteria bacterium 42_54_T18]